MDSDFWTMRLAAAKRQFNMQNHHHLISHNHPISHYDRFNKEFEFEEEVRLDYPCPYCCEEFDVSYLCSHLEAEHPYESKATVCPVCSVKIAGEMLSHITLQHGHLLKFQRHGRLRRVPFPNTQASSLLGRDLREAHLQVLLGGTGFQSNTATSSAAPPDNFLSSLVLNLPTSDSYDISKSLMSSLEVNSAKSVAPQHMWKLSFQSSLSWVEQEERTREAAGRTLFVQDLLVSTLFD